MKSSIKSFEDLVVHRKLVELHLEVSEMTLRFPKFESFELGSQMRRSSNSIAANLEEAWNNKRVNIHLEGINRPLGELRETQHLLFVALKKSYSSEESYGRLKDS